MDNMYHDMIYILQPLLLSVPEFTANLYCNCISIPQIYTIDAVHICGKFWDTQYDIDVISVIILSSRISSASAIFLALRLAL